jgi:hypothetical protein
MVEACTLWLVSSGTPGCAVNEPSSFEVQYRLYELAVAHVRDAGVVPVVSVLFEAVVLLVVVYMYKL